jgi:hypothetical protein
MLGALLLAPVARAEPPASVQMEINFLLGYIEGSGCEFYRNGSWYDSKAAQVHIRDKYKYLIKGDLVSTAEQFIDRAATESSFTGLAYEVKCSGGAAMTSKQWLRNELARLRTY